jgi:bifunctional non-homologous end joining protein LigD
MRAAGWAPKHHPTPLSGGDRKALNNELGKSRVMTNILAGKVGAGWSRTVSSQIRKQLDTVVSPKSKLTKQLKKPKATWGEPANVLRQCRIRDITSEGLLRQSSFKGLTKG